MKEESKDCAFQYAINPRYIGVKIIEDTDLITLSKAKELYNKYLPSFKTALKEGERPEMVIWINMSHPSHYHQSLIHIDEKCEIDRNDRLFVSKKEYINL